MLAARRVQAGRFPDGVPGAGREPSASMETNSVSPATRLQPKPRNLRNGKYTHWSPKPASDSDSGPRRARRTPVSHTSGSVPVPGSGANSGRAIGGAL
eukprot:scaffold27606_cov66-Phaeocystis_antarctica.AAC.1